MRLEKGNLQALLLRAQAMFYIGYNFIELLIIFSLLLASSSDAEQSVQTLQAALKYDPDNKLLRDHFKARNVFPFPFPFLHPTFILLLSLEVQGNRQGAQGIHGSRFRESFPGSTCFRLLCCGPRLERQVIQL